MLYGRHTLAAIVCLSSKAVTNMYQAILGEAFFMFGYGLVFMRGLVLGRPEEQLRREAISWL